MSGGAVLDPTAAVASLDVLSAAVDALETHRRRVVAVALEVHARSAWRASGCTSLTSWLVAHAGLGLAEARTVARVVGLCDREPRLAAAVVEGALPWWTATRLARVATDERAPHVGAVVDALLALGAAGADEVTVDAALRHWADRVDERVRPARVRRQSLVVSGRLFGGGDVHATLAPVSFETVVAAIDAFTQDPDPDHAPVRRTLSERRADALDDLATAALAGDRPPADDDVLAADTFDGEGRTDDLDEALADPDGLVLRSERWSIARRAAEQLACDGELVPVLFDGPDRVLDARPAAPRFTRRQREAIAARDRGCVFPGCGRPPRFCDTHHRRERARGGPSVVGNGCLLCRHHHRLLHQGGWALEHDAAGWVAIDPTGREWRRPTAGVQQPAVPPGDPPRHQDAV